LVEGKALSSGANNGLGTQGAIASSPSTPESALRISIAARPHNIVVVRQVVGALAEAFGLPPETRFDVQLAVTEACANVVRHAYEDGLGPIEITVDPEADALKIVVADHGRGIGPSPDSNGPGLGLPMIAALAEKVEIEHAPGTGCRVAMVFPRPAQANGQ
jgi:serine/threonine-protein kinase RsbW